MSPPEVVRLRAWLEFVIETAIEMLDALDAPTDELECDEAEVLLSAEDGAR